MQTVVRTAFLCLVSIVIGSLVPPVIVRGLGSGYSGDSFFTLDTNGRIGLILLTAVLTTALLLLCVLKTRTLLSFRSRHWKRGRLLTLAMDVAGTIALAYLALYLAPQFFYLYFQFIIEGLPHQLVIGWPPSLRDFIRLTLSVSPASLSLHLQGLTVRTLVILTILLHIVPKTDRMTNSTLPGRD